MTAVIYCNTKGINTQGACVRKYLDMTSDFSELASKTLYPIAKYLKNIIYIHLRGPALLPAYTEASEALY